MESIQILAFMPSNASIYAFKYKHLCLQMLISHSETRNVFAGSIFEVKVVCAKNVSVQEASKMAVTRRVAQFLNISSIRRNETAWNGHHNGSHRKCPPSTSSSSSPSSNWMDPEPAINVPGSWASTTTTTASNLNQTLTASAAMSPPRGWPKGNPPIAISSHRRIARRNEKEMVLLFLWWEGLIRPYNRLWIKRQGITSTKPQLFTLQFCGRGQPLNNPSIPQRGQNGHSAN